MPASIAKTHPREIEATLLIRSDNPVDVVDRLALLDRLDGWRLRQRKPLAIRDVYFDTPDQTLRGAGFGLRIRGVGGAERITLKGPIKRHKGGAIERLEIESAWSGAALTDVLRELERNSVRIGPLPAAHTPTDPLETMRALGLAAIQDRDTQRVVRAVTPETDPLAAAVAEVLIDTVTYHFPATDAIHREVEIEAVNDGGVDVVNQITHSLTEAFADDLTPWPHNKLATGKALEALIEQEGAPAILTPAGSVSANIYDDITATLTRGVR